MRAFAAFVKEEHLRELAQDSLRRNRALKTPLLELVAHLSDEQLLEMSERDLGDFLEALHEGRAHELTRESLRRWEANELPGISREQVLPTDLVLAYTAQKQSLIALVPRFTPRLDAAIDLVQEIEDFYAQTEKEAFELLTRLREEAAQQMARETLAKRYAEEKAEALAAANEELQSQTEELTAANEELQSQTEELNEVYQRLREHTESLDRLVAERTRELSAANEELRSLDLLKDEFISIVSHELRTPVNAITGFGSILVDGVAGALTPEQSAYVEKMLAGADRLLALINDLLDYSRIQAGKFSLAKERLDAGVVIKDTITVLADQAAQKRVRLHFAEPAEPLLAQADPQRLSQVVLNLVGNAIKFTPEGGRITVGVRRQGEFLRCEVHDTGPGIAASDIPKLFQRFGQLDTGPTRAHRGTGLGLVIVKSLVEAHGGEVGVESQPGQGSTFWFTLPLG
ncbi:MAG TPA: ATP-binding protein [Oscillatoriaceae cyanobacterium]